MLYIEFVLLNICKFSVRKYTLYPQLFTPKIFFKRTLNPVFSPAKITHPYAFYGHRDGEK